MKTLVIDTATAACSVALFDGAGMLARGHEVVGRGHAEKLVPMIADLPGRGRADLILVDCGPGSFTGVRVGLAAAIGLGIGWKVPVHGYGSTALIADMAIKAHALSDVAVVMEGGHGELFVQKFDQKPGGAPMVQASELVSLRPDDVLAHIEGRTVVGSGAVRLAELAPDRQMFDLLPDASKVMDLPASFRELPPRPIYGRAPDAKVPA